jgi:hypothetical protein
LQSFKKSIIVAHPKKESIEGIVQLHAVMMRLRVHFI